jgi:hypothetical protein
LDQFVDSALDGSQVGQGGINGCAFHGCGCLSCG